MNLPKSGSILRVKGVDDLSNLRNLVIVNLIFPLKEIVLFSSSVNAATFHKFELCRAKLSTPFIFLEANIASDTIKIVLNGKVGWIYSINFINIWKDIFEELK